MAKKCVNCGGDVRFGTQGNQHALYDTCFANWNAAVQERDRRIAELSAFMAYVVDADHKEDCAVYFASEGDVTECTCGFIDAKAALEEE